jgi:hypothetical protein
VTVSLSSSSPAWRLHRQRGFPSTSMQLRSQRPRLPPELIDRIIDHLHDCPKDLRRCSLVCKACLATSRFHIFYRIQIYPSSRSRSFHPHSRGTSYRCLNLYQIIQKSPDIALYIRELLFSVGFEGRVMMDEKEWPHLETVLPQLLHSLTALTTFEIEGINWTALSPSVRMAFRSVFALPSLINVTTTCVDFARLDHFASILHAPLKRLRVYIEIGDFEEGGSVRVVDEEDQKQMLPGRQPCRLECLKSCLAFQSPLLVDWLLGGQSVIDLSTIHTLDAWCSPKVAQDSMVKVMKRLGSSLEHLTIQHPGIREWSK